MVICLERCADLHMSQLMPLPVTVSCFSIVQIGFAFLVLADPSSPGQRAVKRVCVCVSVCVKSNWVFGLKHLHLLHCTYHVRACVWSVAVRLVGGNSSRGRLEVHHNGQWGTVCDHDFDDLSATVACHELGFVSACPPFLLVHRCTRVAR